MYPEIDSVLNNCFRPLTKKCVQDKLDLNRLWEGVGVGSRLWGESVVNRSCYGYQST